MISNGLYVKILPEVEYYQKEVGKSNITKILPNKKNGKNKCFVWKKR